MAALTKEKFYESCLILQLMGVTEFRVTPELFVALARHHEAVHEQITGEGRYAYMSDDDVLECGRVPYYRGSPFRLAKEFK